MNTWQSPAAPAPIGDGAGRIAALDIVRGVAVLGILTANIVALGQPMTAYAWPGGFLAPPGPLADWLWGAQLVLVDGKFRGLFTLLFGAGMVLFHRRAAAGGHGRGLLARRLCWLGLFGLLHWALLWRGDILLTYAVAGLAALWFVEWNWVKQLTLGLLGYAVGALTDFATSIPLAQTAQERFAAGSHMAQVQAALRETQAEAVADGRLEGALIAAGNQGAMVAHTLRGHLTGLPAEIFFTLFETVPLLLIGMALLDMGLFAGTLAPGRVRRWGWGLWLAGTLAAVPLAGWAMAGGIGYWDSFAALNGWLPLPQLAAALGLLLLLAGWAMEARGRLADRLGAAGRCAFTNYIGASALGLAVFSGWGLGLFGKLGRLELYGVMALFWLVMLAWPRWWLARFRHGPLEWLWRCLTYWRLFPLRR